MKEVKLYMYVRSISQYLNTKDRLEFSFKKKKKRSTRISIIDCWEAS